MRGEEVRKNREYELVSCMMYCASRRRLLLLTVSPPHGKSPEPGIDTGFSILCKFSR